MVIILLLLIGTGSFVFAGTPEQKIDEKSKNQVTEKPKEEQNKVEIEQPKTDENELPVVSDGTLTPTVPSISNPTIKNETTTKVPIANNPTPNPVLPEIPSTPVEDDKKEENNYTYEDVLEAVKRAEITMSPEDIQKALDLLEKLTNSSEKELLEKRLEILQKEQNLTNKIKEIEESINNAQNKEELENIYNQIKQEQIEEDINNLPDNFKKNELEEKIEEILKRLEDHEAPIISGVNNFQYTNQAVTLTIDDEKASLFLEGKTITLQELNKMTENKVNQTYNVMAVDQSWNTTRLTFTIDTVSPTAEIKYNKDLNIKTNESITATLTNFSEEITITNNGSDAYTFNENGEFIFEFQDKAGNIGTMKAQVNNIDLQAPEYKKLGILNYSRIEKGERLDIANPEDTVKVYITFNEKLKKLPIIQLNNTQIESKWDEENSTEENQVYIADYKIDAIKDMEGFMNLTITNIEDEAGNKLATELTNENINVEEHRRVYVILEPGFELIPNGYFNEKTIVIKDPDFHHMTIKRSLSKLETLYTNTYEIPGTGIYSITVYNDKNEVIIPTTKMTYDGVAPTVTAYGYQNEKSEPIGTNNEEVKEYNKVTFEATDTNALKVIRRVDEFGNVIKVYKEYETFTKYETYTIDPAEFTENGLYIIETLDAAGNKTTIQFIIKN